MPQRHDAPSGPLSGITVIECASVVAGPLAAQYLGDMGADVIKVEPPDGDLTRNVGPRRVDGLGSFFLNNNRNKRSIVLDLKMPRAREALHDLVATADVFLHSVRTSAAERLGITYQQLSDRNPQLVHCQVQGFADNGAYGGKPAYDDIIQSLSGLASLQTVVAGEPRYMPAIFADKVAAIHTAFAVCAALFDRERTGVGQSIEVPMFETMAAFNTAEHMWGQTFEPPLGPMGYEPVSTAARRPFRTTDGFVSFLPYSDSDWHRFFELIGEPDVMRDPRFATYPARQTNVKLVWTEIANQMAKRSNAQWVELLGDEDLPFAVVNSLEDLIQDPHLVSVGLWGLVPDPHGGMLRFPRSSIRMSASPPQFRHLPPELGADTVEVLKQMGLSTQDIEELVACGATGGHGETTTASNVTRTCVDSPVAEAGAE